MKTEAENPVCRYALLCNVAAASRDFSEYETPDTEAFEGICVARKDYIHNPCADSYLAIIDPEGKSGWKKGFQVVTKKDGAKEYMHIIILLTESVRDPYLDYLLARGVSFLFCGKEKCDLSSISEKLRKNFGIQELRIHS